MPHHRTTAAQAAGSPVDDGVVATFQLSLAAITSRYAMSEPVDVFGFARAAIIGDEHRHPGQGHRKQDKGQGKPPSLIEHAGKEEARDAGAHQDRIFAPPGSVLLGVGRFRGRDENGGIASLAAVLMLVPRAFASRFDYSRPPISSL
jgi:hypothetical protein